MLQQFFSTGAFGVVHKGELVTADGVIKAVAIKTIKCKCGYCTVCVLCRNVIGFVKRCLFHIVNKKTHH